jgi:feruloyl-CoA synthase
MRPGNASIEELLARQCLRKHVSAALRALQRDFPGSSTHATGAILLHEPPSIDAGEITDKGYINQRAVLTRRKEHVDVLFGAHHPSLITLTD